MSDVKWYAWGEDDLAEAVIEVIGEWRQDLVNELDYVGYTVAIDGAVVQARVYAYALGGIILYRA
jgi:hypothetical protein